ncbi:MAG: hypothetical protein B7Y61_10985 [Rhizobiales bacterium 35-66-30]|nr:MAG: hypothetical protein B7Y61_10985 [Rhizobiales bacterium 35-66-30]
MFLRNSHAVRLSPFEENGHVAEAVCLNEHVFTSLAEARHIVEARRIDYNTVRPHGRLGSLPRRCSALCADPKSNGAGRCARSGASRPAPSHHQPPEQKRSRLNLTTYERRGAVHVPPGKLRRRSHVNAQSAGARRGQRPEV